MHIYYPSLPAIEQQTRQLDNLQCVHCKQTHQLMSHGFIYKKRACAEPEAIGKRVFCSNRRRRTGCGRTMRLYQAYTVRYLHYAGEQVVAFVAFLLAGMSVRLAYEQVTGKADARPAYRWLDRLGAQLSCYRSLSHQVPLQDAAPPGVVHHPRWGLLGSTFRLLFQRFGQPLCAQYQQHTQRSFL